MGYHRDHLPEIRNRLQAHGIWTLQKLVDYSGGKIQAMVPHTDFLKYRARWVTNPLSEVDVEIKNNMLHKRSQCAKEASKLTSSRCSIIPVGSKSFG